MDIRLLEETEDLFPEEIIAEKYRNRDGDKRLMNIHTNPYGNTHLLNSHRLRRQKYALSSSSPSSSPSLPPSSPPIRTKIAITPNKKNSWSTSNLRKSDKKNNIIKETPLNMNNNNNSNNNNQIKNKNIPMSSPLEIALSSSKSLLYPYLLKVLSPLYKVKKRVDSSKTKESSKAEEPVFGDLVPGSSNSTIYKNQKRSDTNGESLRTRKSMKRKAVTAVNLTRELKEEALNGNTNERHKLRRTEKITLNGCGDWNEGKVRDKYSKSNTDRSPKDDGNDVSRLSYNFQNAISLNTIILKQKQSLHLSLKSIVSYTFQEVGVGGKLDPTYFKLCIPSLAKDAWKNVDNIQKVETQAQPSLSTNSSIKTSIRHTISMENILQTMIEKLYFESLHHFQAIFRQLLVQCWQENIMSSSKKKDKLINVLKDENTPEDLSSDAAVKGNINFPKDQKLQLRGPHEEFHQVLSRNFTIVRKLTFSTNDNDLDDRLTWHSLHCYCNDEDKSHGKALDKNKLKQKKDDDDDDKLNNDVEDNEKSIERKWKEIKEKMSDAMSTVRSDNPLKFIGYERKTLGDYGNEAFSEFRNLPRVRTLQNQITQSQKQNIDNINDAQYPTIIIGPPQCKVDQTGKGKEKMKEREKGKEKRLCKISIKKQHSYAQPSKQLVTNDKDLRKHFKEVLLAKEQKNSVRRQNSLLHNQSKSKSNKLTVSKPDNHQASKNDNTTLNIAGRERGVTADSGPTKNCNTCQPISTILDEDPFSVQVVRLQNSVNQAFLGGIKYHDFDLEGSTPKLCPLLKRQKQQQQSKKLQDKTNKSNAKASTNPKGDVQRKKCENSKKKQQEQQQQQEIQKIDRKRGSSQSEKQEKIANIPIIKETVTQSAVKHISSENIAYSLSCFSSSLPLKHSKTEEKDAKSNLNNLLEIYDNFRQIPRIYYSKEKDEDDSLSEVSLDSDV